MERLKWFRVCEDRWHTVWRDGMQYTIHKSEFTSRWVVYKVDCAPRLLTTKKSLENALEAAERHYAAL